jgi:hypothetical protein
MSETVLFDFFGTLTHVVFKYPECAAGVARYYESSVLKDAGRTADVLIEVDWAVADKYLFRARPEGDDGSILEGVRVQEFGDETIRPWTSRFQPLPLFNGRIMSNRLVGLHAGTALSPHGGAIVVVGERGAGKSTFITEFCRSGAMAFGGDESCVLVAGTQVVLPFPHAISLVDPANVTAPKAYHSAPTVFPSVARSAGVVKRLVFIHRTEDGPAGEHPIVKSRAFTQLVTAHRNFGTPAHIGLGTLYELLDSADVSQVRWHDVADLRSLAADMVETALSL